MIKLKRLLEDSGHSIGHMSMSVGLPKSTLHLILEKGRIPNKYDEAQIKERCKKYAERYGIFHKDMFEEEEENSIMQLDPDVLEFFGFDRQPFVNEIYSEQDMFHNEQLRSAQKTLLSVGRSKGRAAIIGPIGSGKTELVKNVTARLEEEGVIIYNPIPQHDEMTIMQLIEGIILATGTELFPLSREKRKRLFRDSLIRVKQEGRSICFVAEEAHAWSWITLRTLKWLSEQTVGREPLMGLIFSGNSPLRSMMRDRVPELGYRCTQITLKAMTKSESSKYLAHKFDRAGNAKVFKNGAFEAIYDRVLRDHENPFPLSLNRAAAAVLLDAYRCGESTIDQKMVASA